MFPKWCFPLGFPTKNSTCISVLAVRAICLVHRNIFNLMTQIRCVKGRAISKQARTGFQEDGAPRFQDSRYMMVVRLSALHTGHLYSSGDIPGTHFC